jgi:hypothetical protein
MTHVTKLPGAVELHLSPSTPIRPAVRRRIVEAGGSYSHVRGDAYKRFVKLPLTGDTAPLLNELLRANEGAFLPATLIFRDTSDRAQNSAWVYVHKVPRRLADPIGWALCRYLEMVAQWERRFGSPEVRS